MLNNIIENEKYTLLLENSLGFIITRKIKVNEIDFVNYAQFKNALKIIYTEKGKRKKTGTIFTDNKVVVIEGWENIEGCFNNSTGEFTCFDAGKFESILNNYNPILKYNC